MNRDDIIRMARGAGFTGGAFCRWNAYTDDLERFANLVAAHEREACARVCDEEQRYWKRSEGRRDGAESCAKAIRARGEK